MVREFALVNELGQKYSLMDIYNFCLLTDPSGLGYEYLTEYEQLGNTFISRLRKLQQGKINGTLNFLNYDNFTNFVNFVESSKSIKFVYKIPYQKQGIKEFYRDVEIESLGKTEKNHTTGTISEPVSFNCLDLWYEQIEVVYKISKKEREVRWNFRWNSRFTSYNTRKITYENKGHINAPIQVEIDGFVENPSILVVDSDGETLFELTIPIRIERYEKFLYSSKENDFYIQKQNTDGTKTSLFKKEYLDIQNTNEIIRLPQRYFYSKIKSKR